MERERDRVVRDARDGGAPSPGWRAVACGLEDPGLMGWRRACRYCGRGRVTLLKAHLLANIRSTSGLPNLDPFTLYVGGVGKRRGK